MPRAASRRTGTGGPSRRPPRSPRAAAGSPPRSISTPSSVSVKIVSWASQPRTSAPQARAMFAYAESPEPPMPDEVQPSAREGLGVIHDTLASRSSARATSSSAMTSAASGRASESMASAHRREPLGCGQQLVDERRHAVDLRIRDDDRPAAVLEVARVERLVVGGRVRVRNEDRRRTRGCELPDRAPRTRDGEVDATAEARRSARSASMHHVVVARNTRPSLVRSPSRRSLVDDRGAGGCPTPRRPSR